MKRRLTREERMRTPRYAALPTANDYGSRVIVDEIGMPGSLPMHLVSVRLRALDRARKLAGFSELIIDSQRDRATGHEFTIAGSDGPMLYLNLNPTELAEIIREDKRAQKRGYDDLNLRLEHTSELLGNVITKAINEHRPTGGPEAFMAKTIVQSLTLLKPSDDIRTNF